MPRWQLKLCIITVVALICVTVTTPAFMLRRALHIFTHIRPFSTRLMTKTLFFCDWDETITKSDTLGLIADAAYTQPNISPEMPPWSYFGETYLADLDNHEKAYGPRDTIEKQFDYLGKMGPIEIASVTRVENSGLFKGVPVEAVREQSKNARARAGWWEFAQRLQRDADVGDVKVIIVSVNWSKTFIETFLAKGGVHDTLFEVYANEVMMDENGKGTGALSKKLDKGIRTGMDKLRVMKEIMEREGGREGKKVVYAGDSNTDLPCLLEADIGVVLGRSGSLAKTCQNLGIKIHEGLDGGNLERAKDRHALYRIDDWTTVLDKGLLD
ncbi:hypothetical protein YB2330_004597 [Saitoella coloradoensis]